ncbi:DUF5677 domain-containing protein [Lysinibacillus sp. A4]|uniref:DUF5677 domain-containing protein n=1 Tax=Lysinibacillus TaxID=400634 RepID=UPI001C0FF77B|nr:MULTISPECIES: DUF5677 domain-containing protein [Lysinibacillus]MBU5252099.1 hypothetical protein [Lysinibacillus capsici]MCS5501845.1 DUF5677 domain-containing protein [Lysinibacillus sp. A4]
MEYKGHKLKKGKFITPFNEILTQIGKEEQWYLGRLPEYIWIALIYKSNSRQKSFQLIESILQELNKYLPAEDNHPRISNIFKLSEEKQKKFYEYLLTKVDKNILSPLTIIVSYSVSRTFAKYFSSHKDTFEEKTNKLEEILKEFSSQHSNQTTDLRYLIFFYMQLKNRIIMPAQHLELIEQYPLLEHDNPLMAMIRPTIRTLEMMSPAFEKNIDITYLELFWERMSELTECELFQVKFDVEDLIDKKEFLEQTYNELKYFTDLFHTTSPLDNKMLVLLGIATFSYKRFLELVEHNLYNTITGRSITRSLIENYIMMKYLLLREEHKDNIWEEYQYYGLGQFKLITERYEDSGDIYPNSHVDYKYISFLVEEYKSKNFIDMDLKYFGSHNIKTKAEMVNESDLYKHLYDYDSIYEHGLWGAIRESSLLKCDTASHQFHCVPDIENQQNLKSVWHDSKMLMQKTLNLLKELYGYPYHLEEIQNGKN